MAVVPFQSLADSSHSCIIKRHVQCVQSAMHLVESSAPSTFFQRSLQVRRDPPNVVQRTFKDCWCVSIADRMPSLSSNDQRQNHDRISSAHC